MNLSVIEKTKVSLLLQITMVLNILLQMYKGFFESPYEKPILSLMAITFLLLTIWELREALVIKDFLVGLLLATNVIYFRFVTQAGYSSLLINFPYFVIGFCLGLLLLYRDMPYLTMYLLALCALAPFYYVLAVLKLESNGYVMAFNRNQIPILLIPVVSLQIANEALHKRTYLFLLPSIGLLVVSYLTKSRTGLILSMCVVAMVAAKNVLDWLVLQKQKKGKSLIKLAFVIVLTLFLILFVIFLFIVILKKSRFSTDGFESMKERFHIYINFLSEMSLRNLLLGFRPKIIILGLHNSFFAMIAYFGAISIFYFVLIAIALYRYSRTSLILTSLLVIWILHSLVEKTSPFHAGDFFIIPSIMLAFPAKRWNRKLITYFCKEKKETSNE